MSPLTVLPHHSFCAPRTVLLRRCASVMRYLAGNSRNLWLSLIVLLASTVYAQTPLRVMVHDSFALSPQLLSQFERQHNAKVDVIKGGDAGEMLNKLILTRNNPIADVVYGLDNSLVAKAISQKILAPTNSLDRQLQLRLRPIAAINYAWVTLNYDRAVFDKGFDPKAQRRLPTSLADLTRPEFRDSLVIPSAATSSTGRAFMLATVDHFGVERAFTWWQALRNNGVKITRGWSDAYYTDFSRNGGRYPLVVSYGTSPAAEVAFSQTPITTSPTANLWLTGGAFLQVEAAAILARTTAPKLAQQFIDFLQSDLVQSDIPTQMWVYPARQGITLAPVLQHANLPPQTVKLNDQAVKRWSEKEQDALVQRWIKVMLK